jgi:predicted nucleic acid-binding protein
VEILFANDELILVASPVSLFELHAVLSRLKPHISLPKEVGATAGVNTLVDFILEDCHLRILHRTAITMLRGADGQRLPLPAEYAIAIRMSERLGLRALDLLHVAYAHLLRKEIDALVTGDEELLDASDRIGRIAQVEVCPVQGLA